MSRSPLSRTKRLFVAIASAAMLAISFTAVASADTIDPSDNSGTVAKGQTRADAEQCKNYKSWYDSDIKAGDKKGADYTKKLADERGCRWAERRVTSTTDYGTVTTEPVGVNPGPVTTEPLVDSGTVATPVLVLAP